MRSRNRPKRGSSRTESRSGSTRKYASQLLTELEEQKTQSERNRLGQFATPEPLALQMLELARELRKARLCEDTLS